MLEKFNVFKGVLFKKEDASYQDFLSEVDSYIKKGYKKVCRTDFGGARFATLTDDDKTINISYKEKSKILRVVEETGINVSVSEPAKAKCHTLVTQVSNQFFTQDCGMCYVIRLSDGNFCVIDGGMGDYDETSHFLEILNTQNENNSKPVIKAWFITHPHSDHYGLFLDAYENYRDKFVLENLIYNFSTEEFFSGASGNVGQFEEIAENAKDFNVIYARTGQKFVFGEDEFVMLFTPDDIAPEHLYANNISLVMKHTVNKRTTLYLGDIMEPGSEILIPEYEKEVFESEIVQVAHHGYWGATNEFYQIMNPETLLWPIAYYHYHNMTKVEPNQFIVNSPSIKNIFYSSLEEITLDMNEEIPQFHPYNQPKELIYDADFGKKSFVGLNWCCVRGGGSPFTSAKAEFTENGVNIKTVDEKPVLLEFVKPPFLKFAENYEVVINGEIKNFEKLAYVYNYMNPKEVEEEFFVNLAPEKGEFTYKMVVKDHKVTVNLNNNEISETPYLPHTSPGIALWLENADIIFTKVTVKSI